MKVFSRQELVCFAHSLVKKENTVTAFPGVTKSSCSVGWHGKTVVVEWDSMTLS